MADRLEDLQVQIDRLDGKMTEMRGDQMKAQDDPRVRI